jgi:hypothetical protein
MKLERTYRLAIVAIALVSIATWFMGYTYAFLSKDAQTLLSNSGYGGAIGYGGIIGWVWFLVFISSLAGLYFYKKVFRLLFLLAILANMVLSPFVGIVVLSGFELTLSDIGSVLAGVVLCLAYTAPLNANFD